MSSSVSLPSPTSPVSHVQALPVWYGWVLSLLVAATTVFVLPWYVPVTTPSKGASYAFGFNNRVAMIGLVVAIAVGTLMRFYAARASRGLEWLRRDVRLIPPFEQATAEYTTLTLSSAVIVTVAMLLFEALVIPYWGEGGYFLSRIDLVATGHRPYVDFQHNYGPLLLYVPAWVQRASAGLLGLDQAYAICVAGGYVAGFVGYFLFTRALNLPPKRTWFVLICSYLVWTCPTFGLNYVPLRFVVVPAALVVLHRYGLEANSGSRQLIQTGVAAFVGTLLCFGISPEMGMAMTAGTLAYLGLSAFLRSWRTSCTLLGATLVALWAMLRAFPGYLSSLGSFSSGANNFPIYPNTHNLLFVIVCLFIFPWLLVAVWQNSKDPRAPLAAALVAAGVTLIGPSLGRCDPGHVVANAVIPLTLMFAAVPWDRTTRFWYWSGAYLVASVVLVHVSFWNHRAHDFQLAVHAAIAYRDHPRTVESWADAWTIARQRSPVGERLVWAKVPPFPFELTTLGISGRVYLPTASDLDIGWDRFIKLQSGFRSPFYPIPAPEILTPGDVTLALSRLQQFDVVLLTEGVLQRLETSFSPSKYEAAMNESLSRIILFPVRSHLKRVPYIPDKELCRLLVNHCSVIGHRNGFVLLKPIKT